MQFDVFGCRHMFKYFISLRLFTSKINIIYLNLYLHGRYSSNLKTSSKTVERYIDLLEKTFVIFRLSAFSRNLRKEIGKACKIYFYDLGIRNSLVNNFNPLDLRGANETGALWENFCIVERLKYNQARNYLANTYFWRTYDQKEIDYIEEARGNYMLLSSNGAVYKKLKHPKNF